jgi:hypothetical protein
MIINKPLILFRKPQTLERVRLDEVKRVKEERLQEKKAELVQAKKPRVVVHKPVQADKYRVGSLEIVLPGRREQLRAGGARAGQPALVGQHRPVQHHGPPLRHAHHAQNGVREVPLQVPRRRTPQVHQSPRRLQTAHRQRHLLHQHVQVLRSKRKLIRKTGSMYMTTCLCPSSLIIQIQTSKRRYSRSQNSFNRSKYLTRK